MLLKQSHRIVSHRADLALPRKSRAKCRTYLQSPPCVPGTSEAQLDVSGGKHHQHSAYCNCRKPGLGGALPLCMIMPRQIFGSSILPTPLIVLMRFILPAASLKMQCAHARHKRNNSDPLERASAAGARFSSSYLRPRRLRRESATENAFAHLGYRVSTSDFLEEVTASGTYDSWRVVSLTWVKALASHMSHEFVQIIAEDTLTGERTRLIADRQETGDWVSITPNPNDPPEMSNTFAGLGSGLWSKSTPYKDRHTLPLPLVSLVFDACSVASDPRPTLKSMAELIFSVSKRCSEYNPLREHCWWFSETILEEARATYSHARLEEWPWAKYRYRSVMVADVL